MFTRVYLPRASSIFSTSRFFATKPAVFINKDTKVICQGFTGRQVKNFSYVLFHLPVN